MTLWFAAAVLCLVAGLSVLLYAVLAPAAVTTAEQRVSRDAEAVSGQISLSDGTLAMTEVTISPDTLYTVYSASGQPVFTNHHRMWFNDAPFTDGRTYETTAGSEEWVLDDHAILDEDGTVQGYIRVGAPIGSLSDLPQVLVLILVIVLPVTVVCALIAGAAVSRRSLQPIAEMTETAEEIRAGDYARRLTSHGTQDEVGKLETTLNDMLDSLETSIEREKQFTSDASHELRTPLAVILGASQTVLDNPDADAADYAAAMRIVYRKGTEMQALLSQMLLLARGHSQRKFMELTCLDYSEIVQDIAEEFAAAAARRNIRLETDIQPDVQITGDLMLITRAVMNLAENGIKYGRQGGWLRLTLRVEDGSAVLTVADNGRGIHPQDLPHIFDRFYRADTSRSSAGSGLGLALVERISSLHGGSVSVRSTPGKGAAFRLELPLGGEACGPQAS